MNTVHLADCLPAMQEMKDNAFDLAVVDPPYGRIEGTSLPKGGMFGDCFAGADEWNTKPTAEYFTQLFRVSSNQIIWGFNYFIDSLFPTQCILVWDKMNGTNPMADAELAWCSVQGLARMFRMHHFSKGYDRKIHPTQKPVALYKWIYANYAKPGQTILDTHVGSGSSRIAAWDAGLDFTGYDIDKDYWEAQEQRFQTHIKQAELFDKNEMFRGVFE